MQYRILERMEGIAHIADKVLPAGSFKDILRQLHRRAITNSIGNSVGEIIEWSKFEDGMLHIRLNNGLEFYAPPFARDAKWWNKYRKSQGTDKQARFVVFKEPYGRLWEQFVGCVYERNYQLQKGDTVIDVGAAWGFNTVDFSRKVGGEGRVVAIEPDEGSLVYLERNIELNACKNVTVVKKGVWSKKDKLKLYLNESSGLNSVVISKGKVGKVIGTVEIEVDTLDNILEELEIDKVTLIKMDIEGAEIEALKGMHRIVSENNDVKVAVASYHIVDGQPTHKTIIPMMEQMGFSSQFKGGNAYFAKR